MTIKTLLLFFLAMIFLSCRSDIKEIKSDMKMNVTEEIGYKLIKFDSKSTSENGIFTDLEFVLHKLNK
jgi:hypothetical protein